MLFQKRHYEVIAKLISEMELDQNYKERIAWAFSRAFMNDNPRFDSERFVNKAKS